MVQQISRKTVTARKAHRCAGCNTVAVQPGETYTREVNKYDGAVYTVVTCTPCQSLLMTVWEWAHSPDEGVGQDAYQDWAMEHRDDPEDGEAARAYLARIGWEPTP